MKRMICVAALVLALCQIALPASAVELDVAGKSAVLMDVATGTILYESNSHERLAPASVTKVMTMLLIMEAVDSGKIALTDMVTASEAAAAKGGSQIYLKAGETMSVSDMLKSIAVSSANDCACAMAEHIAGSESAFVAMMNQRAQELGLIKENQRSGSRVVLVKKIAAALIIALLFAITVYCFNDARSFADGF